MHFFSDKKWYYNYFSKVIRFYPINNQVYIQLIKITFGISVIFSIF